MAYIVTEACIKCKYTDCAEVCPVDCFYEGDNMLVINPEECIDCGVCEPECPVEAIKPFEEGAEDAESPAHKWLRFNSNFSKEWPNISVRKDALPEADIYKDAKNKVSLLTKEEQKVYNGK